MAAPAAFRLASCDIVAETETLLAQIKAAANYLMARWIVLCVVLKVCLRSRSKGRAPCICRIRASLSLSSLA
jgi:hypothetical protein